MPHKLAKTSSSGERSFHQILVKRASDLLIARSRVPSNKKTFRVSCCLRC